MYAFKGGNARKNKLKGISKSQSKHIKFEEYYNCLFGGEYQKECGNYVLRSINHETCLQKIRNLLYLFSMLRDVMKIRLKVNHGTENSIFMYFKYLKENKTI